VFACLLVIYHHDIAYSRLGVDTAELSETFAFTVSGALVVDFPWLVAVRRSIKWASPHRGIWRHVLVILASAAGIPVLLLLLEWIEEPFPLPLWLVRVEWTLIYVALTRFFVQKQYNGHWPHRR
jgi:hypothetical protein